MKTSKEDEPIIHCPTHTQDAFDTEMFPKIVHWAMDLCQELRIDAIAACGHSGLPLAGAVGYCLRLPVFAVRKRGEPTVAGSEPVSAVAPHGKAKRWVWLDDCVCSGGTLAHAIEELWDAGLITSKVPTVMLLYDSFKGASQPTIHDYISPKLREVGIKQGTAIPCYGFRQVNH